MSARSAPVGRERRGAGARLRGAASSLFPLSLFFVHDKGKSGPRTRPSFFFLPSLSFLSIVKVRNKVKSGNPPSSFFSFFLFFLFFHVEYKEKGYDADLVEAKDDRVGSLYLFPPSPLFSPNFLPMPCGDGKRAVESFMCRLAFFFFFLFSPPQEKTVRG